MVVTVRARGSTVHYFQLSTLLFTVNVNYTDTLPWFTTQRAKGGFSIFYQTVVAYIAAVTIFIMENSQPIIMEDSQQWMQDSQGGDGSPFHDSQETLSLPGNGDLDIVADTSTEEKKPVDPTTEEKKPPDSTTEEKKPVDPTTEEKRLLDPTTEEKKPVDPTTEEKRLLDPTTEEKKPVDPTIEEKPEDPTTKQKPVIVENFYYRKFSKECLEEEPENESLLSTMKEVPGQELVPGESSESEVDEEICQKGFEGYKMLTPPGCPVCIMSNAESEGRESDMTPDKIFEILKTYMPLKDALGTFNDMMATTAITTQAKAKSASSSSSNHAGPDLKSKGLLVSKMVLCITQY